MGTPDHLTCLWRNPYAGQEATVRTGHRTTDWLKVGKGVHQGCILSPCWFNSYAAYIMWKSGLDKAQAGTKISWRNINNLRYAEDTTLWQKVRETKDPLEEGERGEWKSCLKAQPSKTNVTASGPISSWQIEGKRWKQWETLFSWAPKSLQMVTAAMKLNDACSLEEKALTKLESILKSSDITLATKVRLLRAVVFPVVMYGCESWTVEKAECLRIDAFEL